MISGPKGLCDPLSNGRNGTTPGRSGLGKLNCQRGHQATIAVALFEEPFPLERFTRYPVDQECVHLWTDSFHEVASQAVSRFGINV
jgi:hypothetical protein